MRACFAKKLVTILCSSFEVKTQYFLKADWSPHLLTGF